MRPRIPMCSFSLGFFIAVCVGISSVAAQENQHVRGEVVDLPCYIIEGGRGAMYQACTLHRTQRKGVPIGVLTDAGTLLLLVNQSADAGPYEAAKQLAGARAQITGRIVRKQGVATLIVESAEGL
jgi:hypothetical protein